MLFDLDGELIESVQVDPAGDNERNDVTLNTTLVSSIEIRLPRSGALDNISICDAE